MLFPIVLILIGIIFVAQPGIFNRGLFKETAITQKVLSPGNYTRYVRVLGVIFIIAGLIMLLIKK